MSKLYTFILVQLQDMMADETLEEYLIDYKEAL